MNIISHTNSKISINDLIEQKKQKIIKESNGDQSIINKKITLLEEFVSFDLGKFLLQNKGLNGYWTEYICSYPIRKKKNTLNPYEVNFLEKIPISVSTQERYQIFSSEIANYFKDGVRFASLPCGLMSEFLTLETQKAKDFKFIGIDLDDIALEQAKSISLVKGLSQFCEFYKMDAWELDFKNEFDLLSSNGLNIYEKDNDRVLHLYKSFYKALKKKGTLIISTLTPSPMESMESSWNMDKINPEDLLVQKIIFVDIIEAAFQASRSVHFTITQLMQAGFSNFRVLPDSRGMFVTIVAQKR
ncbi:class I SAM-dependent methyltransferase [Fluviispira multicolorata]|uniref:Methyltransferase domain-containing protein n=1 Tax=Fluviispira multicolorata TaxID=2654512 RepID=A0A833N0H4_9BACT|nr:class I SAM-dependent methyltransferase [Fluviispira multicolorata]KAB8028562.1 methyltransferase domain-containing protein [Fluviispira multicolorata]